MSNEPGDDDDLTSLTAALDGVVRELGGPAISSASLSGVFGQWREVVGDAIADHADPIAIDQGRLVVAVDQPGWATQLRFLEQDLLTRIDERVGPGVVTSIEVRVRRL
jgi:predicted nucleic acid-binding Zn ribbon protein